MRPDIFVRPHQEVLVHCRLVHCGLVHCRLKLLFLRISFSDLKGDVSSCVGRLKRVPFACSEKDGCRQYRPSPSLSEHIWKLKENNTDHTVTWKILEETQPYTPITGKCTFCTTEKAYIAYNLPSLNKRKELFSTCPHRRKHLLSNQKPHAER